MQVVHGNRMDRQSWFKFFAAVNWEKGFPLSSRTKDKDLILTQCPIHGCRERRRRPRRGIWVMKSVMDEVSFECNGTEVRMRKAPKSQPRPECEAPMK